MKAKEFQEKAFALVGNEEHFKLYTEIADHHGVDCCEVQLWMTDPWGKDDLIFSTTNNGDRITDMLLLNDLKDRLRMFKDFAKSHYDYVAKCAIKTNRA